MNKEQIREFLEGAIVNGISRDIVFPEYSEDGRIEVELVAPPQVNLPTVHLSFPDDPQSNVAKSKEPRT